MHQVWTLKLTPSEASVLAHLADHANDDGLSYPSVGLVAWKSNLSERTVQMALRSLQEQRLIQPLGKVFGGRGHTTRYRLHLDRGEVKPPFREKGDEVAPFGEKGEEVAPITTPERVQSTTIKGATDDIKGANPALKGAATAPEPLVTVKEPSRKERERGDQQRENGKAARRAPSLVPNPFPVTDEMRRQAVSYGVAADRIDFETEKFVDKFTERGEHKLDWMAAWRNWMRRVQDFGPRQPMNGAGSMSLGSVGRSAQAKSSLDRVLAIGRGEK
jgi:hypothetical protein